VPRRAGAGRRTAARNFPALDLTASGMLRPELLVGDAGADANRGGADAFQPHQGRIATLCPMTEAL
jgi:hypothetical protein